MLSPARHDERHLSRYPTIRRFARTAAGALFLAALSTAAAYAQAAPPGGSRPYVLPDSSSSRSNAVPVPTAQPGRLLVTGRLRGYSFDRVNHVQNTANPDRHATEFSFEPHLDYRIGNTPLNIGYSYSGAYGFGLDGTKPGANNHVDNTLPGYPLDSPVHEAYLQYKTSYDTFTVGDQELNYSWTPASDTRVQPVSYQAFDSSAKLSKTLTFGLTDIVRFQARNSSNFEPNTLLTAPYSGATPVIAKSGTQTPGTLRLGLSYTPISNVAITAENYQFYDIASLTYAEGRYGVVPSSKANPYLAVQFVNEVSLGQNQLGRISNHTFGAQLGATVAKGVQVTVSTDIAPWHYALVHAKSTTAASAFYFAPGGGTGSVEKLGTGLYRVAYGGIASPYTDTYTSDPLYTTMLTQGMVERRSAGNSGKIALTYTTPNKQFRFIAAEGYFQYSNEIARNITSEYDLDGTYYLNKVRSGPYHGLLVRVRYASRSVPAIPDNFQYQRFQTEYDF